MCCTLYIILHQCLKFVSTLSRLARLLKLHFSSRVRRAKSGQVWPSLATSPISGRLHPHPLGDIKDDSSVSLVEHSAAQKTLTKLDLNVLSYAKLVGFVKICQNACAAVVL